MRYFRIAIIIAAIAVTVLRAFLFVTKSDIDIAPVIECDKEVIRVKCGDPDEKILEGVKAFDEQDGDLTDKLFIERLYYLIGPKKSRVTFVAIDSDNNITKLAKDVIYTDYVKPRVSVSDDLIFQKGSTLQLKYYFKANDIFDGDITNRLRLVCDNFNINTAGTYSVVARLSNSHGDMTEFPFTVYVLDELPSVKINLKEHITYVSVGEKPDFASFIDDSTPNKARIEIDSSKVDTGKAGGYEVYYNIKNSAGDTIGFNRLIVVVEE